MQVGGEGGARVAKTFVAPAQGIDSFTAAFAITYFVDLDRDAHTPLPHVQEGRTIMLISKSVVWILYQK
ncbi:unnamed protein product [Leptosia nina]|uniref:Uncharacterized protein n=1 Tax=Leptosia nina TaxID=320188 RepID=A0AAV1JHD7_9NEOP